MNNTIIQILTCTTFHLFSGVQIIATMLLHHRCVVHVYQPRLQSRRPVLSRRWAAEAPPGVQDHGTASQSPHAPTRSNVLRHTR